MPKGQFPFLTIKDLLVRLQEEWDIAIKKGVMPEGKKAPSRPTLYRLQERGVWTPSKVGDTRWRILNKTDFDIAIKNIKAEYGID